jgi:hypothetical protein
MNLNHTGDLWFKITWWVVTYDFDLKSVFVGFWFCLFLSKSFSSPSYVPLIVFFLVGQNKSKY